MVFIRTSVVTLRAGVTRTGEGCVVGRPTHAHDEMMVASKLAGGGWEGPLVIPHLQRMGELVSSDEIHGRGWLASQRPSTGHATAGLVSEGGGVYVGGEHVPTIFSPRIVGRPRPVKTSSFGHLALYQTFNLLKE